jgi:crossover junction endodeoxyribonuclease RuvC
MDAPARLTCTARMPAVTILPCFTKGFAVLGAFCRFRVTESRFVHVQHPEAVTKADDRCSCFVLIHEKLNEKRAGMRVLGIDPGLRNLGWGVIDVAGSRLTHVANGICHSDAGDGELALRLVALHAQLTEVVRAYAPDAAAVEHTFVNKDAVATLKLGQARGIALLVPAQAGIAVGEYAPNHVKKTVVGVGHAAKVQVDHMVRLQLPGVEIAGPDAADALAIAICHAHHLQSAGRLDAALRAAG